MTRVLSPGSVDAGAAGSSAAGLIVGAAGGLAHRDHAGARERSPWRPAPGILFEHRPRSRRRLRSACALLLQGVGCAGLSPETLTIQRAPVQSCRQRPRRPARSPAAPWRPGRNSMAPGSKRTRWTGPSSWSARMPSLLGLRQGDHARRSSARQGLRLGFRPAGTGLRQGQVPGRLSKARRAATAHGSRSDEAEVRSRSACLGTARTEPCPAAAPPSPLQPAHQLAGARQLAGMGQADQHHLGRLDQRGRAPLWVPRQGP